MSLNLALISVLLFDVIFFLARAIYKAAERANRESDAYNRGCSDTRDKLQQKQIDVSYRTGELNTLEKIRYPVEMRL